MSILVDRSSRILIQGITGATGRSYAKRMVRHGTPLVGGVSPGKGGETVEGVPVFNTMREAVAATGADAVLSAVPTERALDAVFEVIEAGIQLMVLYSENVPLHDAVRMRAYALAHGMRLLGPNSAGVISPGKANLADINDVNVVAGRIGIVRSDRQSAAQRHGREFGGLSRRRPRARHRLHRYPAVVRK